MKNKTKMDHFRFFLFEKKKKKVKRKAFPKSIFLK